MPPDPHFAAESPAAPPSTEREPNLLHFGLRQWFYFISGVVILCGLFARLEVAGALVLGSIVALVAAHVLGTFLGTRLRDTSEDVIRWKGRPGSADADTPIALAQPVTLANLRLPAATTLAGRNVSSRRNNWALAVGAAGGFACGAWAISELAGPSVTWPGLAMGAVSCGVMGAWGVLLIASFWAIARQALRNASRDE